MITTRRTDGYPTVKSGTRGVDLLERRATDISASVTEENADDAAARLERKRNLEKLLNYDRYAEFEAEEAAKAEAEKVQAYSDEDIRPTTTTTQFIDGDPQIFNDAEKSKEAHKGAYRLNGKGKLVVALYALVVTVILALIVLNTGVLRSLSGDIAALDASYRAQLAAVEAQNATIAEMSSDARVIDIATNEYNMVLR